MKDALELELEGMVNIYSSGGGYGDPDAVREHEWKIELLKHKQSLLLQNKIKRIEIYAVVIATCSLVAALLQIFLALKAC